MRPNDRDDPFDDIFDEIERMMSNMTGDEGPGFADETHVAIYEEDDVIRLVADLPGVTKENLNLQCDGETLTIRAVDDGHEYDERVRLPARVDEHSANASFNNGVLQVTFDRLEDSADISVE